MLVDRAGNEDAARLGQLLQPRGDVHALAIEVVVLHHHVAKVDADAVPHLLSFRQLAVARRQLALHLDRALHGFHYAGELGDHRVAPGVDGAAVMPLDQRIHRGAILPQRANGAGLVAFHQPRIALDVRAQDRRQTAA